MSILDRLNLLVRSNISDMRGSGQGTLRDMESSLRDARRELAQLRVNERKLVDQIREARQKAEQWEDRAMLALRSGNEDLAREALVVKNQHMRDAESLRDRLEGHRNTMRDIESSLEALEFKLEGTRSRYQSERRDDRDRRDSRSFNPRDERDWDAELRRRMAQRDSGDDRRDDDRRDDYRRNDYRRDDYRRDDRRSYDTGSSSSYDRRDRDGDRGRGANTAPGSTPFNTGDTFREFDRMSDKITRIEAGISADNELAEEALDDIIDPRKRQLDQIFDKMERDKNVNDDLSDLKRKFSDD